MSEKIPEKLTEKHHAALDTREAETLAGVELREPFARRVRAVWLADLEVWLAEVVDGVPDEDTTRVVCETREEVLQIARNAYELWDDLDADDGLDADGLEWLAPEPAPELRARGGAGRRTGMTETKKEETGFAVGDWVRYGGHVVGEVVEARGDGEAREYLVRVPKVVIETANRHVVPGAALTAATVEDSHLRMAVEHLEFLADELLFAGRPDDAKAMMAKAVELAEAGRGGDDGCEACGGFAHPDGGCPESGQGPRG